MFYFGVDYYPEHWPEQRWREDARLMAAAGMNVARLAEFAWSRMEPREGEFEFEWLDSAIGILAEQEIRVVLGTPTASAPPWLMTEHQDSFLTRADGRRVTYGHRRNYSPTNAAYREHSRRIVTAMAERYRDHPAVIGWQVDNEFGDRDYQAEAFRTWLGERFGSLEAINERWGTAFWSHEYTAWEQIPVPLDTGGKPNPGLALDFCRFCSDSYVDYQREQVEILREICPEHFITHNLMGFKYDLIDYFELVRDLDLVSWDNYPRGFWNIESDVDHSRMALGHDAMRGLKGKPFWVMEQQAGPGGWDIVGATPRPGELRLWAYQAIGHGADGIVFFRWRTARHGTEQYWHGLLEHDGRPGRRYREIQRMGSEIKAIGERIAGSETRAEVAMVLCYDSRFALQVQPNNPRFDYAAQFHDLYRALTREQVAVDIVSPKTDLARYRLVIVPSLYVLSAETAANLERFVTAGGVLLVTARSGVKDETNAVVERPLPGLLAELCGVTVEEYDSLPAGVSVPIELTGAFVAGVNVSGARNGADAGSGAGSVVAASGAASSAGSGSVWCDILAADGAKVLARYGGQYYSGKPALTVNRVGRGAAFYLGTVGDRVLLEGVAKLLLERAEVEPMGVAAAGAAAEGATAAIVPSGVQNAQRFPEGIEIVRRFQGDTQLLFVLNHAGEEREVNLPDSGRTLVGPEVRDGRLTLPPKELAIIEGDGARSEAATG